MSRGNIAGFFDNACTKSDAVRLRGSIARTLNYMNRARVHPPEVGPEELDKFDLILVTIRNGNPFGLNRKRMKECRKGYRRTRRMIRSLTRMHERVGSYT